VNVDDLNITVPTIGVAQASQDAPGRARYIVRDAKYALQPRPPREAIVGNWLHRGDLAAAYGEGGAKKTYVFGCSLPVCVALGKDCMGFRTVKTKVLIIDEESGENRFSERIAAAIRGELADETIDLKYVCLANFKLDDPTDQVIVQSLIEETGAGLVIIDALADVMDGDENSKQDTQPVFSALRKIADTTNAAIIIIHHSNKAGGYRGSSAIKGAVDLMIEVKSEDGSRFINFKTVKERDIERLTWAAEAVWTEDQFYLRAAEAKEKTVLSKSEAYVIRYLEETLSATIDEIAGHADTCTEKAAERAVYALTSMKLIKRIDGGGRGQKAVYALMKDESSEV